MTHEHPWHTQIHRDAFNYGAIPDYIDQRLVIDLRFFSFTEIAYENHVEFSATAQDPFGMPQVEWKCSGRIQIRSLTNSLADFPLQAQSL